MVPLYKSHRRNLMKKLPNGLILIKSGHEVVRNGDVPYVFRQESNFLYLTGITETHHLLLLDPKKKQAHLFIPDYSEYHQIWLGKQNTRPEAKKKYQVEHVWYHSQFKKVYSKLKRKYKRVYSPKNLEEVLAKLRRIKSPSEITFLENANKLSHKGHVAAMRAIKSGMYEYQLQTVLENEFRIKGVFHNAYPSIVASGKNAAILHYHQNNQIIKKNDLVLIDAGCEWNGYASDVTRTFPASGKFSKTQKEIYEIVLATQKSCIQKIKPGVSIQEIHDFSCRLILNGLIKLGLVKNAEMNALLKNNIHRIFYPHGIGHLLGLDVHDVGGKPRKRGGRSTYLRSGVKLQSGMVVTMEPGIYFIETIINSREKRKKYQKYINWDMVEKYRSVGGIRIEDDILVTKSGFENLTTVPKEVTAIEKLMAQ